MTAPGEGPAFRRAPLLALAFASLLAGLAAGLGRLGLVPLHDVAPALGGAHGPLMVSGFFGTVIGLERAVALGRPWAYAAPVLSGASGVGLVLGARSDVTAVLAVLAAATLTATTVVAARRQPAAHGWLLAFAAVTWLVGGAAWTLGQPLPVVVPWWLGFLVLTIAAERLELSRLLAPTPLRMPLLIAAAGLLTLGAAVALGEAGWGTRIVGAALLGTSAWLVRYDVARRGVRAAGLTRFIALCLLSGYAWLAVGGALALAFGATFAGPRYDATLHAVFVGFVMSMVFAHAPIILPAVLRVRVPYRSRFHVHAALLHVALAARIVGDLSGSWTMRVWGSVGNVAAIVLFFANTISAVQTRARPAA